MATILNSDLTRETTVKVNDREIQLTLTETQKISMKLKGMKSGIVEIGIEELYHQLAGSTPSVKTEPVELGLELAPAASGVDLSSYKGDGSLLMSVAEFRSAVIVSGLDLETTAKFESFLTQFINERKQRKGIK